MDKNESIVFDNRAMNEWLDFRYGGIKNGTGVDVAVEEIAKQTGLSETIVRDAIDSGFKNIGKASLETMEKFSEVLGLGADAYEFLVPARVR